MRLAIALFIVAGCASSKSGLSTVRDNPKGVRDTTGVGFGWKCDTHRCDLVPLDSTPPPTNCGFGSTYTYFVEHFFRIGSGVVAGMSISADYSGCRPAACTLTDECPIFEGADYQCLDGMCQLEGVSLHRYDVEALCLSQHPRSATCMDVMSDPEVKRVEGLLGAACPGGSPDPVCSVPESCPSP